MIEIQYQEWFTWITHTTILDATQLPYYMEEVKRSRPDKKIRAVEDGRILDMVM